MDEIDSLPAEGFTSLKLFMAYKNVFQIDDATLFKAMQKAASHGMIVMVHAENGDVEATLTPELLAAGKTDPVYHASSRPPEIEGEATNRAVVMAGMTGCRLYVVHMTCEQSIDALRRGRAAGLSGHGRNLHPVLLPDRQGSHGAAQFSGREVRLLAADPHHPRSGRALAGDARIGTLQVVSTDHCDFWFDGGHGPTDEWAKAHNGGDWAAFEAQDPSYRRPGKELGKGNFAKIPNGLPAIEDRLVMLWNAGVNTGKNFAEPLCRTQLHQSGQDFRHVPAKRHDCRRIGRRHCRLGSQQEAHHQRQHPPHAHAITTCSKARKSPACRCWSTRAARSWSMAISGSA